MKMSGSLRFQLLPAIATLLLLLFPIYPSVAGNFSCLFTLLFLVLLSLFFTFVYLDDETTDCSPWLLENWTSMSTKECIHQPKQTSSRSMISSLFSFDQISSIYNILMKLSVFLWPVINGTAIVAFSWLIIYFDSKVPGIYPPTPLSPLKHRSVLRFADYSQILYNLMFISFNLIGQLLAILSI